jgi:predicted PurR-regulated permease PerM
MSDLDNPSRGARNMGTVTGYSQRVFFVVVIAALALLVWRLSDVLLLLFGAIIVAVALKALARPLERYLRLSPRLAVGVAVVIAAISPTLGAWLIGDRLIEQISHLRERLPDALGALTTWLNSKPFGAAVLGVCENAKAADVPWSEVANAAAQTLGAIGSAGLMVVVGIYMAADPRMYRDGFVRLIPPRYRSNTQQALVSSGHALSRWLLGQRISMLFVGSATTIGLAILGMPLALSL